MKFTGTKSYIATDDLSLSVNAAIALERPLLIKGEPGTGKTMLALEVAKSLETKRFLKLFLLHQRNKHQQIYDHHAFFTLSLLLVSMYLELLKYQSEIPVLDNHLHLPRKYISYLSHQ